ncbi:MAG: LysR family transcriptional regulator [Pseudomonadota bacterium]
MSLQHLRSFVEVYRCLSISEAARTLGLTQPAVSQHISALEAQLDRKLFSRRPRGVVPTALAHDLANQIGNGLDRAELALATMKARSTILSGTVHIAGPPELLAEKIAPRLKVLQASGLDMRLHLGGKASLYEMLPAGDVDLAFTASEPKDKRLGAQQVGTETLLAVAAPPMAKNIGKYPTVKEALRTEPHVAYDTERPLLRDWCADNGVDMAGRLPAATAPDLRMVRALVENEVGWSVIPDYLCSRALAAGSLTVIATAAPPSRNQFFLVWGKSSLRHPRIAFARSALLGAEDAET